MSRSLASASARSIRSKKSQKPFLSESSGYDESVQEFEVFFADLCAKCGLVREVVVRKEYKKDEYYKYLQAPEAGKRRGTTAGIASGYFVPPKPSVESKATDPKETVTTTDTDTIEPTLDEDAIIIAALYDHCNRFVEIFFYKVDELPRELIKLLSLIARYYIDLRRLKIQFCKNISGATIYEISKLISASSISEVDLDGCYCKSGNYGILFDSGRIINMSLSKCCINDEVCEIIASKICLNGTAANTLYSLSLSSNNITDVGAISLANALRTNRTLRCLNLAANRITDTGACCLLDTLKEFMLTQKEMFEKSKRYMEYERKKMVYYWKFLRQSDSQSSCPSKKSNGRKKTAFKQTNKSFNNKETKNINRSQRDLLQLSGRSPSRKALVTYEDIKMKANLLASEMMGPFHDPYKSSHITIKQGKCFSKGNMTLCYLNLAFNDLGYQTVVKLLDVLNYQNEKKADGQIGLVRAIIKGNNIPIICNEYVKIDELLAKSKKPSSGKPEGSQRRKKSSAMPL